jgi:hypothetical protein
MVKIQIIVCGWWFDEFEGKTTFIDNLNELKNANSNVSVFWSCHKEPPKIIVDNFDYKVFENEGLEHGAYDQALNHLDLKDDVVCYFFNDDMYIHNWNWLPLCTEELLSGHNTKFVMNGVDYGFEMNAQSIPKLSRWRGTTEKVADYVKPESKKYFMENKWVQPRTLRTSFIGCIRKTLKDVNDFEWCRVPLMYDFPDHEHDGCIDTIGNLSLQIFAYKIGKVYGFDKIKYLSPYYRYSKYMTECLRGKHSPEGNIDRDAYQLAPGGLVTGAEILHIEDLIWKK